MTEVPALVRRYLKRVLPPNGRVPRQVRVAQSGEMWQKPRARALRFTAVEELAVAEVAFTWRARFPIAPLLALHVDDWCRAGDGALEVRLFGVPLRRSRGAETAKGEAMRYLAELPWVPHAMHANPELEWRELDASTVEVATTFGSAMVAVRLEFDAAGDVVGAFADARPRLEGKTSVPTPWRGVFGAYQALAGVRVPTTAEVRWELPEGPFTYFRSRVTGLETGAQGRR